MRRHWVYSPHSGGRKIPPFIQEKIQKRILFLCREALRWQIQPHRRAFRGQFCYIDAYIEPHVPKKFDEKLFGKTREEHIARLRETPFHLCRLRYSGREDDWSMAFYTYSHEKYEPCLFHNGSWTGTPEDIDCPCCVDITK